MRNFVCFLFFNEKAVTIKMATELGIFSNKLISKYCVYIYCLFKILCWEVQSDYDLASLRNLKTLVNDREINVYTTNFYTDASKTILYITRKRTIIFPREGIFKMA